MWRLPGAMSTRPGNARSPGSASLTDSSQISLSQWASIDVKLSGICCTITMPASISGGIRGKRYRRAFGPPEDAPIAIRRPDPVPCPPAFAIFPAGAVETGPVSSDMFARAAAFTFEISSFAISARFAVPVGLHTKSNAPFSSACIVRAAPRVVSELSMTTGVRCRETISASAVSPSIRGMSTSRVTTSGFSCSTLASAKHPSIAVAITSVSGSLSRILEINLRISAESSTTRTRILFFSDCIGFQIMCFAALVFHRVSEDHFRIHYQHHSAVAQQRGPGQRVVLYPTAVQGFDYKLLFAQQFVGNNRVAFITGDQDNQEHFRWLASKQDPASAPASIEAEHGARSYKRNKSVVQPVVFDTIQMNNARCLDCRQLAYGKQRQGEEPPSGGEQQRSDNRQGERQAKRKRCALPGFAPY